MGAHLQERALFGRELSSVGSLEVNDLKHRLAAQFSFGPPERVRRSPVHVGEEPFGVQGEHAFRHVVHDHRPELLGFLELSNVHHDDADTDDV